MKKMRCRYCIHFCYDHLNCKYELDCVPFCGLHGRAKVDPDGFQQNLDRRGSCGFFPKLKVVQLEIIWS